MSFKDLVGRIKSGENAGIVEEFVDLLEELNDSIDSLNWGGCGISALAIYKYLIHNDVDKKDLSFMALYNDEYYYSDNVASKMKYKTYCNTPSHIGVVYRNDFIDSEGIDCGQEMNYPYSHPLNEDDLLHLINECEWNDEFERKEEVPLIEQILEVDLEEVDLDAGW